MTSSLFFLDALVRQTGESSAQTVWDFLAMGGPVMWPIGICSVLVIGFALERWTRLGASRVVPAQTDEVVELVRAGRMDEALQLAEEMNAPSGRVLAAGLRRRGYALRDVEGAMEDQGHKELERLRGNLRVLTLVAAVAPLLGLLGTVIGIQEAFHQVANSGMGKPENLADGIQQALVTTIAGLCVAIPAMLLAAYLNAKARRLILRCDDKVSSIVERVARKPGERHAA